MRPKPPHFRSDLSRDQLVDSWLPEALFGCPNASDAAFVRPVAHNQPDTAHQHSPTANLDDLGEGSAHDYRPKGGSNAKTASKGPRKC